MYTPVHIITEPVIEIAAFGDSSESEPNQLSADLSMRIQIVNSTASAVTGFGVFKAWRREITMSSIAELSFSVIAQLWQSQDDQNLVLNHHTGAST